MMDDSEYWASKCLKKSWWGLIKCTIPTFAPGIKEKPQENLNQEIWVPVKIWAGIPLTASPQVAAWAS
jgi:hypothetical protein